MAGVALLWITNALLSVGFPACGKINSIGSRTRCKQPFLLCWPGQLLVGSETSPKGIVFVNFPRRLLMIGVAEAEGQMSPTRLEVGAEANQGVSRGEDSAQ